MRAQWKSKRKVRAGAVARKRRAPRKRTSPTGYLKVIRRTPEMFITNSSVANTPVVVDSTGSCLQLGAPVPNQWGTYDLPFSTQFMLSQVLNSSDITNIADKYRIKACYIRLFFNSSNSSVGSAYSMPQVYHITDHDDSTVPTVNQVREKMGVKYKTFKNASSYIGIKLNPRPLGELYKSALSTGYSPLKSAPWIDCNNNDVPHYGLKGVLTNVNLPATSVAQTGFKFDITLVIEAKDIQ